MAGPDPTRLGRTLSLLLKHRPELGRLALDEERWASVKEVSEAAEKLMRQKVVVGDILHLVSESGNRFLELDGEGLRIRARQKQKGKRARCRPPELLYHGTSRSRMRHAKDLGKLGRGEGQEVYFSTSEAQAWKVAHRLKQEPVVLIVEARRASRDGVMFRRGRGGLYLAESVPIRHVLNLRNGFAEQFSAGGFLVRERKGTTQVALVSCRRGRRKSWEIAKGKLEPGETPQEAAKREIQEEMGFSSQLKILHDLGVVHYSFDVPQVGPRLKRLYVYVLTANPSPETFEPREEEGIQEVRWFSVDEARRMVPHPSLRPVLSRLVRLYKKEGRNER